MFLSTFIPDKLGRFIMLNSSTFHYHDNSQSINIAALIMRQKLHNHKINKTRILKVTGKLHCSCFDLINDWMMMWRNDSIMTSIGHDSVMVNALHIDGFNIIVQSLSLVLIRLKCKTEWLEDWVLVISFKYNPWKTQLT